MDNNEAHIHKFRSRMIPSTCKEQGYTLHRCECGYSFKDRFTPTTTHDYVVAEEIPATCTQDGEQILRCIECDARKTVPTRALDHDWGEWEYDIAPTCTEPGTQIRRCTRCEEKESAEVPATGHDLQYLWDLDRKKGIAKFRCENCGQNFILPSPVAKRRRRNRLIAGIAAIVLAVLLFSIVAPLAEYVLIPGAQYYTAKQMIKWDQDEVAFFLLSQCKDFKNSEELLSKFKVYYTNETTSYYDLIGTCRESTMIERNSDGNITYYAKVDKINNTEYRYNNTYDSSGNLVKHEDLQEGTTDYQLAYDSRGNLTESIAYVAGNCVGYNKYSYDANNNLIEKASYDANGTLLEKYVYSYDGNGNKTLEARYSKNGYLAYKFEWQYDQSGNVITRREYDETDSCIMRNEYTYSNFDQLQEEKAYNSDGLLQYRIEYVYDITGKLTEAVRYSGTGFEECTIAFSYDLFGNMTKQQYRQDNQNYYASYTYGIFGLGNRTAEALYNTFGEETGKYEYTYNWLGLVEKVSYYESGKLVRTSEYSGDVIIVYTGN